MCNQSVKEMMFRVECTRPVRIRYNPIGWLSVASTRNTKLDLGYFCGLSAMQTVSFQGKSIESGQNMFKIEKKMILLLGRSLVWRTVRGLC